MESASSWSSSLQDSVFVNSPTANLFVISKSTCMVLYRHGRTRAAKYRVAKNVNLPTGAFPVEAGQSNAYWLLISVLVPWTDIPFMVYLGPWLFVLSCSLLVFCYLKCILLKCRLVLPCTRRLWGALRRICVRRELQRDGPWVQR